MDVTGAVNLRNQMLTNENALNKARQTKLDSMQDSVERRSLEDARLREVADDFESLFTKMLIDSMNKTLNKKDDLFYGGQAQEIFDDMLNEEHAKNLAKVGTLGISDMIVQYYKQA